MSNSMQCHHIYDGSLRTFLAAQIRESDELQGQNEKFIGLVNRDRDHEIICNEFVIRLLTER